MTIPNPDNIPGLESEPKSIEVEPSTNPIQDRLKKAYIDKYNHLAVTGMTPEDVDRHIADLEDMVKVLQAQVQAGLDRREELHRNLSAEEREKLRISDRKYRTLARPATNSDGTIKTRQAKPAVIGDSGTKAFESLVTKLTDAGMTRENAVKMIQGMKK